jgi:hypothetical protein
MNGPPCQSGGVGYGAQAHATEAADGDLFEREARLLHQTTIQRLGAADVEEARRLRFGVVLAR